MKRSTIILLGFIVAKIILQYLLIHPEFELHRDEFLHVDLGEHISAGYISVPPLTGFISFIIIALGKSVFWVKFFPALFGALTILFAWKITEKAGGKLFAQILCATALLLSSLLRLNMLYQPNSLDIFWWTLIFYLSICFVEKQETKWIYLLALSFAFAVLSKYNVIFLMSALLVSLVVSSFHTLLKNPHFYLAILLALVIVSPNIYWQIRYHFPTYYQLKELQETQLVNVRTGDFLKEQVLFFINSLFIIIIAFLGMIFYKPFRKYRFVALTYVLVIAGFVALHAKAYYAVGLYPVLIALGAVYTEYITRKRKIVWRTFVLFLVVFASIPMFLVAFPLRSPESIASNNQVYKKMGMLRWEDGQEHKIPQDFADMLGWKELARITDSAFSLLPANESIAVFCDNYGEAGAINFYSNHPAINALSFNADYIYWIDTSAAINNVIRVYEPRENGAIDLAKEKTLFDTIYRVGSINNPNAREQNASVYIMLHAKPQLRKIIAAEVKDKLNH